MVLHLKQLKQGSPDLTRTAPILTEEKKVHGRKRHDHEN